MGSHSHPKNPQPEKLLTMIRSIMEVGICLYINSRNKMDECDSRYTKSAQIATRTTSVNICVIKRYIYIYKSTTI